MVGLAKLIYTTMAIGAFCMAGLGFGITIALTFVLEMLTIYGTLLFVGLSGAAWYVGYHFMGLAGKQEEESNDDGAGGETILSNP